MMRLIKVPRQCPFFVETLINNQSKHNTTMMKQLLLTLFMVMLTSITLSAYDFEVDGIYYNINGTEATVTYKDMYSDIVYRDDVIILETVTYNGTTYSVTAIGDQAFEGSWLTSINIPSSVTTIGVSAFDCSSLTKVISRAVNPPSAQNGVFDSMSNYGGSNIIVYEQAMLFVPNESLEAYRAHEEWGRFTHIVPFLGSGPGDLNGDGRLSISDVTALISQVLAGNAPAYCDVNGDGNINISDVTTLISWILSGN